MINKTSKNFQIFSKQHLLAIDFGEKFTGISTYKVDIDPFPLAWGRIPFECDEQLFTEILKIGQIECVDVYILGIPRLLDGQETNMTKRVRKFYTLMQKKLSAEKLFLQDETLSSFEAKDRMKSSPQFNFQIDMKQIDAVAATIIMEEFVSGDKIEQ